MSDIHPAHMLLIEDDVGRLVLEKNMLGPTIHCEIHKWSPNSYKYAKEVWDRVIEEFQDRGALAIYAARLPEDNKLKKFAEKFGFKDTEMFSEDSEGNLRRIMICELE